MDLNEYMNEDISIFGIDENPFNRQNYQPKYRNPDIIEQLYNKELNMSQYTKFNFPVDLSKNRVLKGNLSGDNKNAVITSIRRAMNEGLVGEELANDILSKFDEDILAAMHDDVKALMEDEYGVLGHLYFDTNLYKNYKEALLKFNDRRRKNSVHPQYLMMDTNCPGCNHDQEGRCRKFQMPIKKRYDYGWDEVKPLIQRLLQSRLNSTKLSQIIFHSDNYKDILKAAVLYKEENVVKDSGVDLGDHITEARTTVESDVDMIAKVKQAISKNVRISSIKNKMIGKIIPNSMVFDSIVKKAIKSSNRVNVAIFDDCQSGLVDFANKIEKKAECDSCKFNRVDSCSRNGKLFYGVKIESNTTAIDENEEMIKYLNSTFSKQELGDIDLYVDNLTELDHQIFDR